ncbi:nucleoid occlusion protein [Thermoflavimicrobium daqui]|jgi:ParB family chromosome partitioning protein|uniref:Nucleoid occlusion protein n=1 Tax=Thermoflavimicrobium daqui TaxID=2137476 RepID=A0A364K3K5_9BACL|nr:nucleoid occlusion protein [Thermoflavimicrobium daqui]RAL23403.1 nucleoid occlusion protein [Thermoflavimicrobium daqui]
MKESITRWFSLGEKGHEMVRHIPVEEIEPSPYQPRTLFNDERIDELCQTIQSHGIIQPIVVRRKENTYELIAGERRLRAVKKLELSTIPAIVREMTDSQAASAALIENLQREGLTSIEEAYAYQKLIEIHHLTQESLAQRLGKGQSTIANKLRLLQLPKAIHDELLKRKITERHARSLLALKREELQLLVLQEILDKDLNVKQTEERVRKILENEKPKDKKRGRRRAVSRDLRIAVNTIRQSIHMIQESGMKVVTDENEHDAYYELVIRIPK